MQNEIFLFRETVINSFIPFFIVDHSKFKTGVQAAEAAPDRGDKQAFNYEEFWSEKIEAKKRDHSYRVFRNVERDAESFPRAKVSCSGSHVNLRKGAF